jgi:hypothetical protein
MLTYKPTVLYTFTAPSSGTTYRVVQWGDTWHFQSKAIDALGAETWRDEHRGSFACGLLTPELLARGPAAWEWKGGSNGVTGPRRLIIVEKSLVTEKLNATGDGWVPYASLEAERFILYSLALSPGNEMYLLLTGVR